MYLRMSGFGGLGAASPEALAQQILALEKTAKGLPPLPQFDGQRLQIQNQVRELEAAARALHAQRQAQRQVIAQASPSRTAPARAAAAEVQSGTLGPQPAAGGPAPSVPAYQSSGILSSVLAPRPSLLDRPGVQPVSVRSPEVIGGGGGSWALAAAVGVLGAGALWWLLRR